jgi:hypothetical protein
MCCILQHYSSFGGTKTKYDQLFHVMKDQWHRNRWETQIISIWDPCCSIGFSIQKIGSATSFVDQWEGQMPTVMWHASRSWTFNVLKRGFIVSSMKSINRHKVLGNSSTSPYCTTHMYVWVGSPFCVLWVGSKWWEGLLVVKNGS